MFSKILTEHFQGQYTRYVNIPESFSNKKIYLTTKYVGANVARMQPNQAKKLKELEKENSRLKKLVADLSLDKQILESGFLYSCFLCLHYT